MKKISIIVTVLAFVLGLSQCKKEQVAPTNENNSVAITLDIKSNGGTRMDVNTGTGEVNYEENDVVYVASGGKYIGTLTHNGINFSGTITNPIVGEPLHFYFLGNVTPAETLTAGTTTSCSVVISNQTEHLPVIEYAPSNETYTSGAISFTAFLLNKCALVKFNVTTSSEAAICVSGFNNMVTVDFMDTSFTYSKTNGGNITLSSGSGEKWAILLPQEAMEAGVIGSAYSEDGVYTGTRGVVPAISENGYLTTGIAVTVNTLADSEIPEGAINGKFTINSTGGKVYFSQGNLQFTKSTGIWSFMEHQYDMVETVNQNVGIDYANQDVVSLFGWGTSGYNHGAICYQPWSTSRNDSDYYAYGLWNANLNDQTGMADWGYNAISNGGNEENQWRTLTKNEWDYILFSRSGTRYAKSNVNGVNGVILLPDGWNTSIYLLNDVNVSGAPFSTNTITVENWMNLLEANGAVFLPAAGYRMDTFVYDSGNYGNYSSASYENGAYAYHVHFDGGYLYNHSNYDRYTGMSVRLVQDVN